MDNDNSRNLQTRGLKESDSLFQVLGTNGKEMEGRISCISKDYVKNAWSFHSVQVGRNNEGGF